MGCAASSRRNSQTATFEQLVPRLRVSAQTLHRKLTKTLVAEPFVFSRSGLGSRPHSSGWIESDANGYKWVLTVPLVIALESDKNG